MKPCRLKQNQLSPSSDSEMEVESNPGPSREQPKCKRSSPAWFVTADDSSDSSGNKSDTVSGKCNQREADQRNDKHVFWIL